MAHNLTIGSASKLTGVEPWRLRRWEEAGLLRPQRSRSGYRIFGAADVERIVELREAAESGDRMRLFAMSAAEPEKPAEAAAKSAQESLGSQNLERAAEEVVRWAVARGGASWGALVRAAGRESVFEVVAASGRSDIRRYEFGEAESAEWRVALNHDALVVSPGFGPVQAGESVATPLRIGDSRAALLLSGGVATPILEQAGPIALALEQAAASDLAHKESERRERESALLRGLMHELASAASVDEACEAALDTVLTMTGLESGTVSLVDAARQQYSLRVHRGLSEEYVAGIGAWKLNEGIAGRAYMSRTPLVVPDLQVDSRVTRRVIRAEGLRSFVVIPMVNRVQVVGVFQVFSHERRRFERSELDFATSVAAALASTVASLTAEVQLEALREDRGQALREWTAQVTAATTENVNRLLVDLRQALAAELQQAADSPDGDGRGSIRSAAARIEQLLGELSGPSLVAADLASVVVSTLLPRLRDDTGKVLQLEAGDWPTSLSASLSARLYSLLEALLEAAAASASGAVRLVLDNNEEGLRIVLCDDRAGPPDLDAVASIPVEAEALLATLGATATATAEEGFSCAVEILVPRGPAPLSTLTKQQRRVLEALAKGGSNNELAGELGISSKTLQNHLTAIYRKLGVTSRAQAISLALRLSD